MVRKLATATPILIIVLLTISLLLLSWEPATPNTFLLATPTANSYLPYIANFPPPTATTTPIPPDDEGNELATALQINTIRTNHDLAALDLVPELVQAARRHSRDMADNNFTSHTGSDGTNGCQRMQEAGYDWSACGEIIGWGFGGSPSRVIDAWMNSPPHRAIILSSAFEDNGVGYAVNSSSSSGHYWTVNFGKRSFGSNNLSAKLYRCYYRFESIDGGGSLLLYSRDPCQGTN